MRARYIGPGHGKWKGIDIRPGAEFDVPERLQGMVAINANFVILDDVEEVKRKPGRPRKDANTN